MQFPNPKIKFYKTRTFSEKFNVSFDFLRETWKPLLKFSLYLILPVCLIQAFIMNAYMRFAFSMGAGTVYGGSMELLSSFLMNYGILMLCILTGSCLLSALVYALMQEYERRESRLIDITWTDFKLQLVCNLKKMAITVLFLMGAIILCSLVMGLLAAVSPWTLVITAPLFLIGLFVLYTPLSLFTPFYIFEDQPFSVALSRAFKYGFSAWGETFLVLLVFGLLGNIISSVTMMPWYVLTMIKNVFTLANEGAGVFSSWWYDFIVYLLGIVQAYGAYLSSIIVLVGLAFQYFHIREKKEGVSVNESIANFDQL